MAEKQSHNKRALGTLKEERAAAFLATRGYQIIKRNFYTRTGEIDIVAQEEGYLVFIEVKYRANLRNGSPAEAVNGRKIASIVRASSYFMKKYSIPEDMPCRFDVVSILGKEITLIKNAFEL